MTVHEHAALPILVTTVDASNARVAAVVEYINVSPLPDASAAALREGRC